MDEMIEDIFSDPIEDGAGKTKDIDGFDKLSFGLPTLKKQPWR